MKLLPLIGLVAWLFPLAASASGKTLKEAIRFALDQSPVLDSVRKTREIRQNEYRNTISKMLHSVDFATTNGLMDNIPIASTGTLLASNPSSPWYSSLSLGVSETLYDNGVTWTQSRIADLEREIAELQFEKARDTLVLEVASEFYRFSLANALLETRTKQQALLEKQFKTMSGQYQQGFKTRSDYLRLKTQVQRAEIERVSAENRILQSKAELNRLLGADPAAALEFAPLIASRDAAGAPRFPGQATDADRFYDFRVAALQNQINDRRVSFAERLYWPQLSLSSEVAYSNQNYLNSSSPFAEGHQLTWNALVTLRYNLWDWGIRRRDVANTELNRGVQDNQVRQGLLELRSRIVSLGAELDRSRRGFGLTRDLLALEEESNRDLEERYREGKSTYLGLITSLNSLLDAKVQYSNAYFDALQSLAKHDYYEGKIYETLVGQ